MTVNPSDRHGPGHGERFAIIGCRSFHDVLPLVAVQDSRENRGHAIQRRHTRAWDAVDRTQGGTGYRCQA